MQTVNYSVAIRIFGMLVLSAIVAHKCKLALLLQLFTKAWTAGLLNGLGDLVSQKFVEKNDDLDFKRLGIFTLLVCQATLL